MFIDKQCNISVSLDSRPHIQSETKMEKYISFGIQTFNDNISFLNSSSYVEDMMVGETFSCQTRGRNGVFSHANKIKSHVSALSISYLPTPFDDFVIDIRDDHGVDDGDPKHLGQNPLQDIEPDVRAVTRKSSSARTHSNNLWLVR